VQHDGVGDLCSLPSGRHTRVKPEQRPLAVDRGRAARTGPRVQEMRRDAGPWRANLHDKGVSVPVRGHWTLPHRGVVAAEWDAAGVSKVRGDAEPAMRLWPTTRAARHPGSVEAAMKASRCSGSVTRSSRPRTGRPTCAPVRPRTARPAAVRRRARARAFQRPPAGGPSRGTGDQLHAVMPAGFPGALRNDQPFGPASNRASGGGARHGPSKTTDGTPALSS